MNRANLSAIALIVLGFVLFMFAVAGCSTQKKIAKQERKAEAFYNQFPKKLLKKSEIMFPDRISQMVKGIAYVKSDSVAVDSVSVSGVIREMRTIEMVRVDTIYKEDGRQRATIQILNNEIDSINAELIAEVRAHAQTEIAVSVANEEAAEARAELAALKAKLLGAAVVALILLVSFLVVKLKSPRLL
jgi:hypothetical protein